MKLEQQVCSLELAKKLKELGVKQDGYFCYYGSDELDSFWNANQIMCGMLSDNDFPYCSAFTVAELGEMLPTLGISWIKSNDGYGKDFWWGKTNYPTLGTNGQIKADDYSEADARAKMLIHLIEKKLINN